MLKHVLAMVLALATTGSLAAEPVTDGTWTTIDYDVEGIWRIEVDGDRLTVRRNRSTS